MRLLAVIALLCGLAPLHAQRPRPDKAQMQDLLILEDGSYLRGRVSQLGADSISVVLAAGPTLVVAKSQVRKLFRHGKKVDLRRRRGRPSPSATHATAAALPAEPLPLPFGRALMAGLRLMPGTDASGTFSMGASGTVGWVVRQKHMPSLALLAHLSRYDYTRPSFAGLTLELAAPLRRTRWHAGMYAGVSAPYTLTRGQRLTDVGWRPMGGLWLGRLWHTAAQPNPVLFQLGLRWQQAHYSLTTPTDFQIVKATFLRYELGIVMYRFAQKKKRRQQY